MASQTENRTEDGTTVSTPSKPGVLLRELHREHLKRPWSYTTGAVLLAIVATMLITITGRGWGVTGAFAVWGGKVLEGLRLDADTWPIFNGALSRFSFFRHQPSMTNLGIVLGAFMAAALGANFRVRAVRSGRQVGAAVLGGLLMGIGARLALGCNIGAMFSAIPAFSISGWVFLAFSIPGAWVGSILLKKWFI